MRTAYLLLLLTFGLRILSQDTLYFKNQQRLAVVLLEINPDNVKYKRFDNKEGATYTVLKNELNLVKFKNGSKEVFSEPLPVKTATAVSVDPTKQKEAEVKEKSKDPEPFFEGDKADVLVFRSGKRTEAKVLIVNNTEVKYKLFSFQDGPTYHASKSELSSIQYGNGRSETFSEEMLEEPKPIVNETPKEQNGEKAEEKVNESQPKKNDPPVYEPTPNTYSSPSLANETNASLYARGQKDARRYYKGYGGAIGTGCAAVGCTPVIGLIPAVMISTTEPDQLNMDIPNSIYRGQPEYMRGYTETAYRLKKQRTWAGYGIGAGIFIAVSILALLGS